MLIKNYIDNLLLNIEQYSIYKILYLFTIEIVK